MANNFVQVKTSLKPFLLFVCYGYGAYNTDLMEAERISRRSFNKILKGSLIVIGLEACAAGGLLEYGRRKRDPAWLTNFEKYPDELVLYGGEGVRLIDKIEKKLNLLVSLPGTYKVPFMCRGADVQDLLQSDNNKAWTLEELGNLSAVADTLPDTFKMPSKALLLKYPVAGIQHGGCMSETHVGLFIPEIFEPTLPDIWPTREIEMAGVFVHELAHEVVIRRSGLVEKYGQLTGWRREGDKWVNPDNLANKFGIWRIIEEEGPEHELVWAISIYATRSDILEGDPGRFTFIRDNFFEGRTYSNR